MDKNILDWIQQHFQQVAPMLGQVAQGFQHPDNQRSNNIMIDPYSIGQVGGAMAQGIQNSPPGADIGAMAGLGGLAMGGLKDARAAGPIPVINPQVLNAAGDFVDKIPPKYAVDPLIAIKTALKKAQEFKLRQLK